MAKGSANLRSRTPAGRIQIAQETIKISTIQTSKIFC